MTTQEKVIMRTCERCANKIDSRLLYTVRDKKIFRSCGDKEVAEWNRIVSEAEASRRK